MHFLDTPHLSGSHSLAAYYYWYPVQQAIICCHVNLEEGPLMVPVRLR